MVSSKNSLLHSQRAAKLISTGLLYSKLQQIRPNIEKLTRFDTFDTFLLKQTKYLIPRCSVLTDFWLFQLTLEDDEIGHLLDPQTGEINKDNFVSYSLERKLLDAQETNARRKKMQKEDELNRKERLLRRQASFVQPPPPPLPEPEKITEDTERSDYFTL